MKPIIADLVLPDIDGLTLLKRARELCRVVKTFIRNQCTLNDQMQE